MGHPSRTLSWSRKIFLCQRRWRARTRPSLNSVDALQGAPSLLSIESLKIEEMLEMCFRNQSP